MEREGRMIASLVATGGLSYERARSAFAGEMTLIALVNQRPLEPPRDDEEEDEGEAGNFD